MSDMRKLEALEWAIEELEFYEFQKRASEEAQKWHQDYENWCADVADVDSFQRSLHEDIKCFRSIEQTMDQDYMTSCNQMLKMLSSLGFSW